MKKNEIKKKQLNKIDDLLEISYKLSNIRVRVIDTLTVEAARVRINAKKWFLEKKF